MPHHRPCLLLAVVAVLGLLTAHGLVPPAFFWLLSGGLALATAGGLMVFGSTRFGLLDSALLVGLLCAVGLQYQLSVRLLPTPHITSLARAMPTTSVQGVIAAASNNDGRSRLILERLAVPTDRGWQTVAGKLVVNLQQPHPLVSRGDRIQLEGQLLPLFPRRNPGGFDEAGYWQRQGVYARFLCAHPQTVVLLGPATLGWDWQQAVIPIRHHILQTITTNLAGKPAALLRGILLGDRQALPEDLEQNFDRAGVIHLLAVSGLHVGLITLVFFTLFRALRLPTPWASLGTVLLLLLYMGITHFRPSVTRAGTMIIVVLIGRLLDRNIDLYNIIGLAALGILLVHPTDLFALGFQLSFVATLAILYLFPRFREWLPQRLQRAQGTWYGWVVDALLVSLAAQLGTFPLVAYHFNRAAPIGLLANLVVVPLAFLAIALGIAAVLASLIHAVLGSLFCAVNWLVLAILAWIVEPFARVSYGHFSVPTFSPWAIGLFYLGLVSLAASKTRRAARYALIGVVFIGAGWWAWQVWAERANPELVATFLDVGQGDSAIVELPGGQTMLIDAGGWSPRFDAGERIILPFLRHKGIDRLDWVVLSHPHLDHAGGLPALLRALPVGRYVDGGSETASKGMALIARLLTRQGIPRLSLASGDTLVGLAPVRGRILHPDTTFVKGGRAVFGFNNGSLVLQLSYGEIDLLFSGDIEWEAEQALLTRSDLLASEVLKVPHHGSKTSSLDRFLQAVRPQVAIISVGLLNRFGQPAPVTLDRYHGLGTTVYRTDRQGAVILHTDGHRLRVRAMVPEDWLSRP